MAEYIEREAILKDYQTICNGVECARCPIRDKGHCKFEAYIRSIPAADVRPVVFCRDCKHSTPWYSNKSRCFLWHEDGIDVFNDGFCNYGEKREES